MSERIYTLYEHELSGVNIFVKKIHPSAWPNISWSETRDMSGKLIEVHAGNGCWLETAPSDNAAKI